MRISRELIPIYGIPLIKGQNIKKNNVYEEVGGEDLLYIGRFIVVYRG